MYDNYVYFITTTTTATTTTTTTSTRWQEGVQGFIPQHLSDTRSASSEQCLDI